MSSVANMVSRTDGAECWSTDPSAGPSLHDQWQAMVSETHLPWRILSVGGETGLPFHATAERRRFDDLAVVDCVCDPCSGTRGNAEIAATDGEFAVVLIIRNGTETVSQGGAEANLKTGDVVAWDSTMPAKFAVWERLTKRSLLIPSAALDEVNARAWLQAGTVLHGASPATQLLTGYLEAIRSLANLEPVAVSAARNATLELFGGAMRSEAGVPSTAMARPALRAVIERYIDRNLPHGDVGLDTIAAAHCVSRRTVNRAFSDVGQTLGEVIRARRLARARCDVVDTDLPISAIAHRWGFSDGSHFCHAFKDRYGSAPREYRQTTGVGAP
ncbi:MAG TPA: AraC family transcriptional regulator [Acidimicrobiales bacterium]|nr:AraC family transcriptional regulator [Acidimicrobiales bacterium]